MAWLPQSPQNAPYDAINISLWKPTMKKDEHNSFGQMVSADDVGGRSPKFVIKSTLLCNFYLIFCRLFCSCPVAIPTSFEVAS